MSFNNSSCTLFQGDMTKCQSIITLKRITSSISLIASIFMITIILLFRKYKVTSQRLILYLSIAALFNAVGFMIGNMTPEGLICDIEAWSLTYFGWAVLMWICCITFNLYQNVIKNKQTKEFEKYYHLLCWIFPPLLFSLIPLADDAYGPAGAWCWVKHEKIIWRFSIWYVPVYVIIAALAIIYFYIIYCLKKEIGQGNHNSTNEQLIVIRKDINILKIYPFVYLLFSIFLLILRIYNAATDEGDDVFVLWILAVLTAPLQGAGNAIAFGLDPETRKKLSWNQVQLTCANRFQSPTVQKYPTNDSNDVRYDENTDINFERQTSLYSQDRKIYD